MKKASMTDMPDISELPGAISNCACGKIHTCSIKSVVIKRGATEELRELCREYNSIYRSKR